MTTYNIAVKDDGPSSVTVFFPGAAPLVATSHHTHYDEIVKALVSDEDETTIRSLFDLAFALARKFEQVSERVMINCGKVYFDGEVLDDVLTQTILKFYQEGNDEFKPLVAFLEKVFTNPDAHSRTNLYRWLANQSFAIAPDGDFIAYKSVQPSTEDGVYWSIHNGGEKAAIVDGEWVDGFVPNKPGSVISMPRGEVAHDPSASCSTGLHVGSWRYAKDFTGNTVLRVKVNPRDVVSVPTDAGGAKLRCCRYQVIDVVTKETPTLFSNDEAVEAPAVKKASKADRRATLNRENRDTIRALARKAKIEGRGRMNKDELIEALLNVK